MIWMEELMSVFNRDEKGDRGIYRAEKGPKKREHARSLPSINSPQTQHERNTNKTDKMIRTHRVQGRRRWGGGRMEYQKEGKDREILCMERVGMG